MRFYKTVCLKHARADFACGRERWKGLRHYPDRLILIDETWITNMMPIRGVLIFAYISANFPVGCDPLNGEKLFPDNRLPRIWWAKRNGKPDQILLKFNI